MQRKKLICVLGLLTLLLSLLPSAVLAQGPAPQQQKTPTTPSTGGAIIDNGTIQLGVNDEGHLNVDGGTPSAGEGTTYVGVRYMPFNTEATAPGCLCEGWGLADMISLVSGYANEDQGGAFNITPISFVSAASTAVSVVEIGGIFRVTHDYHPSAVPNLYESLVTIENIGAVAVDPVYRRVMDWDVEPTAFDEFVTIDTGTAVNVAFSSDNGFASADPLSGPSSILFVGEAVDSGPGDHGALFDFDFDPLAPGESLEFKIFYGAAGTEADAFAALAAVGAEVYSFGQPNTPDGPTLGTPNTFIFAFSGVGGAPIVGWSGVKTVDKTDAPIGDVLTYEIELAKAGAADPAATLVDAIPAGASYIVDTLACSAGICLYDAVANQIQWHAMADGAQGAAISFQVVIDEAVCGDVLVNAATLTPGDGANPIDLVSEETTVRCPDLYVDKSDNPDSVIAGAELTYSFEVGNTGDWPAHDVMLYDYLPADVWFVSATADCWPVGGEVVCDLGHLDPGQWVTFDIVVMVNPFTRQEMVLNSVYVGNLWAEWWYGDNWDDEWTDVEFLADSRIDKHDIHYDPALNGEVRYNVTVCNDGPSAAFNVVVTDQWPMGLTFMGSSGADCSPDPNFVGPVAGPATITCNTNGALAPGQCFGIELVGQINGGAEVCTNAASVATVTPDPNLGNNSTEVTTACAVPTAVELTTLDAAAGSPALAAGSLGLAVPAIAGLALALASLRRQR